VERNLDKLLSELVEEIEHIEVTRERFGEVLRKVRNKIDLGKFPAVASNIIDKKFYTKIEPTSLSGLRIAGIDGGLVRKRFRSMDLVLTRGVAVIFQFGPEDGPVVDFYPDAFPEC
jgi:hypothetical protein